MQSDIVGSILPSFMRKLFFVVILLLAAKIAFAQDKFVFPKESDYPDLIESGKNGEAFVPEGWQLLDDYSGDLNGDTLPDYAMVVQGRSEKFINKNNGLGTDPFNTNPRILIILFG